MPDRSGPDLGEDAAEIVSGEIRDFVRAHEQRRRQVPRAIVVGAITGLVAVAFTRALVFAEAGRLWLVGAAHQADLGIVVALALGAFGVGIALSLVAAFAPETSGSGIPHLEAVLHHLRPMRWMRVLAVKFAGGVTAIGSGLALGREGPTIQMGGAIGQAVSEWIGCEPVERRTLVAAGAGAGLAAAFNAPLSGLVFVLEELQRDFAPAVFTAVLVASVVSDLVERLASGQLPIFHVATHATPSLLTLPPALVLGLAAGVLGVAFNRALLGSLDLFRRLRRWPPWLVGTVVGAAVGLVGWVDPEVLGGGDLLVVRTLEGGVALSALPRPFVERFALTMVSYGCGAPGGLFAPLLVLGSQLGLAVGLLTQHLGQPAIEDPIVFAVVGMAAYFTAIVRAPLTGIVLMIEMTGDYALVLPLLVACLAAYGVAELLGDLPIYEALLERDLMRGQAPPPEGGGTTGTGRT
jgi:CIC family chloride channel protein